MSLPPKSQSVTADGAWDGWTPTPGFVRDVGRNGETQVIVSVPAERLAEVHAALVAVLQGPLSVLYRQLVDRRSPRPQGSPPRDFVAVGLSPEAVRGAVADASTLVYRDARAELWVRGRLGDQVVLDADGLIYCQPDDPAFEDALTGLGVPEGAQQTILERDYARHWFHAACDNEEDALRERLGLTELTARPGR